MTDAAWIAVDWGTTNLRAWAMGPEGEVLDAARSSDGMGRLEPGAQSFGDALAKLVGDWLPSGGVTEVVACGMVGARQGWTEVPYRKVPVAPLSEDALTTVPCHDERMRVHIAGGVSQTNPPDVMRGEETQIAGFLSAEPGFNGVVAMPGTHSKWVQIVDGEIFHFASFMTGELYALLSEQSVLRHSVNPKGFAKDAFAEALEDSLAHPERVAARLFGIRAEHLLQGADPDRAASRLSGYLLGLELAGAKPYWLGQPIALMASGLHAERYAAALDAMGASYTLHDPDDCVLDGLRAAQASRLQTKGSA